MTNEGRVGPKSPVSGGRAVCSSQHPIVTDTMRDVLAGGGTAVDALIAGSLVQAVVQQDLTNHAGMFTMLFWEAETGTVHELNSHGMIAPDLPPFHRVPPPRSQYSATGAGPYAVIPGFMPGMKALYERFATRPWAELCAPAVHWAEVGHVVDSFEHMVMAQSYDFFLYTPSGRAHFAPGGHLPQVGDRWPKPELHRTMRRLAEEGPDYFITGGWAQDFLRRANELGWPITEEHMAVSRPEWGSGLRYEHRGHEIVQLSPPERQAVFCSMVLGILDELDITSVGHYTESAEALYYLAHALRRADKEANLVNDPRIFEDPAEVLMSREFHAMVADLIRRGKPKIDLTKHVEVTGGAARLAAIGHLPPTTPAQSAGSCELSIVDQYGNWVQSMNTLQGSGIPGEVIGGVPMIGSNGVNSMDMWLGGWFTGGGRMRCAIGNTLVLKDGRPVLGLGSPGSVYCTVPQVLSNILDYGMDPYAAEDAPRLYPLRDDYQFSMESRVPDQVARGVMARGLLMSPLPAYDWHLGSFQMSWRGDDGRLSGCAGPRRAGSAAAL
ncbi:gamma-glutamyltransferase [Actinosynnema sp. NPDC023587]|uniref:gamma-glutamyltransferase n=1 Tax=Actinosynnema sp. NPDC023587 TaxID=3154695 RepID=UPI0033F827FB